MKMVVFLFLTQEKKQKNMHLKRIAKSSLRSGKKNNSSPDIENKIFGIGFVKQIFLLFLHSVQILYAILLMCKMLLRGWTFGHFDFNIGQEFLFQNVQVSKVVN